MGNGRMVGQLLCVSDIVCLMIMSTFYNINIHHMKRARKNCKDKIYGIHGHVEQSVNKADGKSRQSN